MFLNLFLLPHENRKDMETGKPKPTGYIYKTQGQIYPTNPKIQMNVNQPPTAIRAVWYQPLCEERETEVGGAWCLLDLRTGEPQGASRPSLGCEWADGIMAAEPGRSFAPPRSKREQGATVGGSEGTTAISPNSL